MYREQFPYTNFHGMNLDWIIGKLKEIETKFDEELDQTVREKIESLMIISSYDAVTETLTIELQIPPTP